MCDAFALNVLYRRVYAHVRDRLDRLSVVETDAQIRRDPLAGSTLPPELSGDPEVAEAVEDAVRDALDRRRPRW